MFYCCDTMPGLHFFNGGDIVSRGGFIHQRRTMEMADVLFGVSMQGDGVTKVISQKLDQALKHAE